MCVHVLVEWLALNPGFPFRILSQILSRSFREKRTQAFRSGFCLAALEKILQSCETKSGTETLGSRLGSSLKSQYGCVLLHWRVWLISGGEEPTGDGRVQIY